MSSALSVTGATTPMRPAASGSGTPPPGGPRGGRGQGRLVSKIFSPTAETYLAVAVVAVVISLGALDIRNVISVKREDDHVRPVAGYVFLEQRQVYICTGAAEPQIDYRSRG